MRSLGALLALLAGCFNPQLAGQVECPTGQCPGNLVCIEGVCERFEPSSDAAPPVDAAAVIDAASSRDALADCVMYSFQQGQAGYNGTVDTDIDENDPDTPNGLDNDFEWDTESGGLLLERIGLIRFDDIFGPSASQMVIGSEVISATLTIVVVAAGVPPPGSVREMLGSWSEMTTWNTFNRGDISMTPLADAPFEIGVANIDVTKSLRDYSAGATNYGWAFVAASTNGVGAASSEAANETLRPRLDVMACPPP